MPLTTINLISDPQTGKSLVALGAAKEFIRRYGPTQCAIIFPNSHTADWSAKKNQLPRDVLFSAGRSDHDLEEFLIGKMFVVCEDVLHWPLAKFDFFLAALARRQENIPETVPRTLIITRTFSRYG